MRLDFDIGLVINQCNGVRPRSTMSGDIQLNEGQTKFVNSPSRFDSFNYKIRVLKSFCGGNQIVFFYSMKLVGPKKTQILYVKISSQPQLNILPALSAHILSPCASHDLKSHYVSF